MIFPFVKKRQSTNFQILLYHRVNDDNDAFFPGVPNHVFKDQMEYLAANFHVCSLEHALERMINKDVPDNTIVVTFDDGYRDNYLNAFPILNELSIPATIFLTTDAIDSQRVIWHDRVFSAFRETDVKTLEGFGYHSRKYSLLTLEEKLVAQRDFLEFIRTLDNHGRLLWIEFLLEKLEVVDHKELPELMLSWEEVKIMFDSGISFGSHTVSHPILSKISVDDLREEIQESKTIIEQRLGVPITNFAYPNGMERDFNEYTKRVLKESGYACALTTKFGTNDSNQDLFELRRATPWDQDIHAFALRLNYYKFCF
jgi:peptidoglycan/xylan/chitin deacetylase (PgdA/CDA1 family)